MIPLWRCLRFSQEINEFFDRNFAFSKSFCDDGALQVTRQISHLHHILARKRREETSSGQSYRNFFCQMIVLPSWRVLRTFSSAFKAASIACALAECAKGVGKISRRRKRATRKGRTGH